VGRGPRQGAAPSVGEVDEGVGHGVEGLLRPLRVQHRGGADRDPRRRHVGDLHLVQGLAVAVEHQAQRLLDDPDGLLPGHVGVVGTALAEERQPDVRPHPSGCAVGGLEGGADRVDVPAEGGPVVVADDEDGGQQRVELVAAVVHHAGQPAVHLRRPQRAVVLVQRVLQQEVVDLLGDVLEVGVVAGGGEGGVLADGLDALHVGELGHPGVRHEGVRRQEHPVPVLHGEGAGGRHLVRRGTRKKIFGISQVNVGSTLGSLPKCPYAAVCL